jgi:hypothetical protein
MSMRGLSLSTKIAMGLFTFQSVAFGALEIYGVTQHSHNTAWPHHAELHAMTGLFDELTLCGFALVLTWTVLKRGMRWAWWALAAIGSALFGGLVVGNLWSHGGLSAGESLGHPELFTEMAYASVVLWVVALALSWAHTKPQGSAS